MINNKIKIKKEKINIIIIKMIYQKIKMIILNNKKIKKLMIIRQIKIIMINKNYLLMID